jgi:hypothetical protein
LETFSDEVQNDLRQLFALVLLQTVPGMLDGGMLSVLGARNQLLKQLLSNRMGKDLLITLLPSLLSFSQHKTQENGSVSGHLVLQEDETGTRVLAHLDIIVE